MLKKLLRIVSYLHLFVALALLLTYCSVRKSVVKSYDHAKKTRPYDVIIVPGIPYEKSETSMVMKMRIQWAKHLYDSGFTHNIIFSGSAVYSPFVEETNVYEPIFFKGFINENRFTVTWRPVA